MISVLCCVLKHVLTLVCRSILSVGAIEHPEVLGGLTPLPKHSRIKKLARTHPQLRHCHVIVREILHKKNAALTWPFLAPGNRGVLVRVLEPGHEGISTGR